MITSLPEILPDIVRYAERRGLQKADAQDIAQEVAARALAAPPADGLRAWCGRVAVNLVIDRFRKERSTERHLLYAGPLEPQESPDTAETVARMQDVAIFASAITRLPERQQQVVHLVDIEGRAQRDVAEQLGISYDNVRRIRCDAHKALRKDYLRSGGSVAGLVMLLPTLKAAARLRTAVTASAVVAPAIIAASLVLGVAAAPITTNPVRMPFDVGQGQAVHANSTSMSAVVAADSAVHAPVAARKSDRASRLLPSCDRYKGTQGVPLHPGVCEQTSTDPNVYAIGVLNVPVVGGTVVTQDLVDPRPVCPIVTTLPNTVCQKGWTPK